MQGILLCTAESKKKQQSFPVSFLEHFQVCKENFKKLKFEDDVFTVTKRVVLRFKKFFLLRILFFFV